MKRYATLTSTCCLGLMLMSATFGCVTQSDRRISPTPEAGERITPRVGLEAPADLHDISGFLLRYRVTHQRMPETLMTLRADGIMPPEGYPGLENYAYRGTGLGTLADGRTVIVVDTSIRIEGHAWCILTEPSRNPRTATLAVSLVPMPELQAAARRAQ
ncbi:MAG: hypothetical protein ACIAXF_02975 [Phycisphaerales bacterium JB063]